MATQSTDKREAQERALDIHTEAGRIRGWRRSDDGRRVLADLNTNARPGTLELRTPREVAVFLAGLASAGFAPVPCPECGALRWHKPLPSGQFCSLA
jgi:hypothetical protein